MAILGRLKKNLRDLDPPTQFHSQLLLFDFFYLAKPLTGSMSVAGPGLENAASYLSAAVLVGLLRSNSQNGLNLVSAPAVAKDMGLQVGGSTVVTMTTDFL